MMLILNGGAKSLYATSKDPVVDKNKLDEDMDLVMNVFVVDSMSVANGDRMCVSAGCTNRF
jgi:hypothetical protein